MAPAVSLCRRSAACLVSYSTVSSARASRCVMENNDPRNSPWILHCTETCNYKLCILSDTGSYFSCTRISFAFKMSSTAVFTLSICAVAHDPTWQSLHPTENTNLSTHRPVLLTGQQSHLPLLHKPLAHQTASASSSYRNACGQLLVMPSHSATHMAWHLSNSEARNSHSYIPSVWQQEWGAELFSCTPIMALMAKKREPALQVGSAGRVGCGSGAHLGLPTSKGQEMMYTILSRFL